MALTAVLLSVAGVTRAHAQDSLEKAKSLYLEAAYEDALAVLDSSTTLTTADGHLYRALCLLALGRSAEADAAIARSIEVDPQATATATLKDLSPRVAAVVAETRKRVLPDVAKRRVSEGRLLFQQGDKVGAAAQFTGAVRVLDDPVLAGQNELQDLKMLASGFLDLIRAQTPPPAQVQTPPPAQTQAPASATAPGAKPSVAPGAPPPATPPVAAAREPEPASSPAAGAAPVLTRPIPISQVMPIWRPPDANTLRQALKGSVLLSIDPTGRVVSAVMQQVVHPAYDRLLLAAARSWRYQPATRDGQPIDAQLVVPIVLQAR
jgi:TonB family protein